MFYGAPSNSVAAAGLKVLPTPKDVSSAFPVDKHMRQFLYKSRSAAHAIVSGADPRLLIIAGPCSLHDRAAAKEFGLRLRTLSREVEESCLIIMRAFCEKPRTLSGWKGLLYDPDLDGSHDLAKGLYLSRHILWELTQMEVPLCAEFLEPLAAVYFEDLITWGIIGARTASSQLHRQLASSLQIPVGFKNSVDGSLDCAIYGMLASSRPHASMTIDEAGRVCQRMSSGNPYSHIVLRGSTDRTNYDRLSIHGASVALGRLGVKPRILIDCSHGNSQQRPEGQIVAFRTVLASIANQEVDVMGCMLESHLEWGHQAPPPFSKAPAYGISITDPCIDWLHTEALIRDAAQVAIRRV